MNEKCRLLESRMILLGQVGEALRKGAKEIVVDKMVRSSKTVTPPNFLPLESRSMSIRGGKFVDSGRCFWCVSG